MAVTQVITDLPTPPQSTDAANFRPRADSFVTALDAMQTELNTAFGQINSTETNINAKEASTVIASDIAVASANFKGTWSGATAYTIPSSVILNGLIYMAILDSTNKSPDTEPTYWTNISFASQIHASTNKTTPIDADEVGIWDSVTGLLNRLSWANIKTTLEAYFDTIYANLVSPTFTGTPSGPTATLGTNTTQLATTEFVQTAVSGATFTVGTSIPTTSGTSINIGSIPTGTKQIVLNFHGVSTSGTSDKLIQLGTGGVPTTSGYSGASSSFATGVTSTTYSTGVGINSGTATHTLYGSFILSLSDESTNTWDMIGVLSLGATATTFISSGGISLSGSLDFIRVTTVGGTDTFDGGKLGYMYI